LTGKKQKNAIVTAPPGAKKRVSKSLRGGRDRTIRAYGRKRRIPSYLWREGERGKE